MKIVEAIESGKLDELKAALSEHASSINHSDINGEYPIHKAVKAKSVKMVEMLIEAGANINQASEEVGSMRGYTAAHYAARNGDVDSILLLAKKKADFSREAADHWHPVHCAAFSGKRLALLALLDNGADVNAKNQHGHTPLVYAVNHGRTGDVRELISRGASLEVSDPNGDSLLHHCFHYQMSKLFEGEYEMPEVQLDVAVLLAIAGYGVDKKNNEGNTADFYLKDDIPSLMNVLKIVSHNSEKFRSSKTEWNYMTLVGAKPEHFLGIQLEMKHAMDLYEQFKKVEQERKDAKKRREEERPAGGCPVMRGKKKKPEAAGAAAEGSSAAHPSADEMKNYDPNGPDPSGGQCPFFKKPATSAPAAETDRRRPTPVAASAPAAVVAKPVAAALDSYAQGLAVQPVHQQQQQLKAVGGAPELTWAFVYENRTSVMMMLICFFGGMIFEQWCSRILGRH
ncbi:Hypothetical protein, putative [Bodo saltans]|uniref:Uncharacterized protein n=1 Tax=Bodo saltans TaxID=75058 RepID=A0A0S4IPR4_BODSA|nr:Hypothetical protein, putative [Bodo saltans]|eukprot:CUF10436.1 Hypothetical protein, putative [Bodo saltans]